MLKKIAIAMILTTGLISTAEAQDRYRHNGHHRQHQVQHHRQYQVQHHRQYQVQHQHRRYHQHHRGHNNNWAIPLVGGLILGGVVGALASPSYGYEAPFHLPNVVPGCYQTQMIDQWGRVVVGTICQ